MMNNPKPAHPDSFPQANKTIRLVRPSDIDGPGGESLQPPKGMSRLEKLLLLEGDVRQLPTRASIQFHAVNESRDIVGYQQAFCVRVNRHGKARIESVSSLASVEPTAPLVNALCKIASKFSDKASTVEIGAASLSSLEDYPFRHAIWSPFLDSKGKVFGGLVLLRDLPWKEGDLQIADRVGRTYAHAIRAVTPPSHLKSYAVPKRLFFLIGAVLLLLAFLPVPLTTLAPFEIVAAQPSIVAAPLNGVIEEIAVPPNSEVQQGQLLFKFESTQLHSEEQVAARKVAIAKATLETAQNGAFSDDQLKRSLSVSQKELDLAETEYANASAHLDRVSVRAPKTGMLIYSSVGDWIGKPVSVGERIMEIADPKKVRYRIDLGVHDAIALEQGGAVKLFLDAAPLEYHKAVVSELSYHAMPLPDGQLGYRVFADSKDDANLAPRIGLRGTAQILGQSVSLGFYLLRRPIAAIRQTIGY